MNYIEIGSKEYKKVSLCILIGSIVNFALMYSPQPLISLYSELYHVSPETASLSISLTTITMSICLFFVSLFISSWNRKLIMSFSLILTSLLAIFTAFLSNFYLFLVLRFFEGIVVAGFPSIAMTYLNEEFSPKDIGKILGYYVSGTAIGGFLGRILTGIFTDLFSWQVAFLIQGSIFMLASVWFTFNLPDSKNFNKTNISFCRLKSVLIFTLFNSKLVNLYLTGFLLMGAYISILNYIGYPLSRDPYDLSQTAFGFLFVVNLVGVFSSAYFGNLSDQYSRRIIMCIALSIFLSGTLLTLEPLLFFKIIGVSLVAFGFFAGHAVASSWVGFLSSRRQKCQASSYYLFFYYLGASLLGWAGGFFLKLFGWNGIVFYVSILLIIAFFSSVRPLSNILSFNPVKVFSK
ncbi:major facilitator superfamily MFS_1 [Thermodesulfobium narugense DSM 14796]|uniref:Major facilitator superfamily MFS_1 n=1 Tax=Thermodesulfobium narugense DSM 14796 TaxID=747365 RepID=M1E7N6_9BACT|nr:MFS transporter [Thermodesulfobium narugense]AEE14555.1 major facilitator superfamily MFS_1 [Thermodesulfobium narugense DSM 14796]